MPGPTLPNLLIIGAQKAGTTSLHNYLSAHPEIFMSKHKELNFFESEVRWRQGVDWYKANFNADCYINGESSPRYTRFPFNAGVPERIRSVLGTPRIIYMVRDPVERLLSQYPQETEDSPRTRSFESVLPNIESAKRAYIEQSSYFLQLAQYLKVFPRESIHIVVTERLDKKPKETLLDIFRFLGVDENFWSDEFSKRYNVGIAKRFVATWFERVAPEFVKSQVDMVTWMPFKAAKVIRALARIGGQPIRKPKLSQAEDLRLQGLLRDDVVRFRELVGDSFPEWRSYA